MPIRNVMMMGDVIVEFVSRAEVVITGPAVVTDMVLLVPSPLPMLAVALVGDVVVALVRNVVASLVGEVAIPLVGGVPVSLV